MADTLNLFGEDELPIQLAPPSYFKLLPRRLETDFCCPRCAYSWSGNPKPSAEEEAAIEAGEEHS